MPPMDKSPTGPLDRDGRLQTDLACLKCGYNLRGLPEFRRPECRRKSLLGAKSGGASNAAA